MHVQPKTGVLESAQYAAPGRKRLASLKPSGAGRMAPYPTLAPPLAHERRDGATAQPGSETCGYRTDAQFRPFACGSGLTCTNSNNVRGCCTDCQHSTLGTGCLDATHRLCVDKTAEHRMQYCCTDFADVPFCATYLWSTTTETRSIYTLYICESTAQRGVQILAAEPRPPNGGPSERSTSTSVQGSPTAAPAESTGPPVGAIVGGVLGGVAVLALLLAAVWWAACWRRRGGGVGKSGDDDDNVASSAGFEEGKTSGDDGSQLPPPPPSLPAADFVVSPASELPTIGQPGGGGDGGGGGEIFEATGSGVDAKDRAHCHEKDGVPCGGELAELPGHGSYTPELLGDQSRFRGYVRGAPF
ncbi:hypothetical protein RB597_005248 [Gaeumannomyces tritici]